MKSITATLLLLFFAISTYAATTSTSSSENCFSPSIVATTCSGGFGCKHFNCAAPCWPKYDVKKVNVGGAEETQWKSCFYYKDIETYYVAVCETSDGNPNCKLEVHTDNPNKAHCTVYSDSDFN